MKNDRTAWYSNIANDYPALPHDEQKRLLWSLLRGVVRLQCWSGKKEGYLQRCRIRLNAVVQDDQPFWFTENDNIAHWLEVQRPQLTANPVLRRRYKVLQAVRQRILLHNQRLIIRQVHRRPNYSLEYGDLIMEGNVGLIRAVDLFDPRKAYRFSTYAHFWIEQAIKLALKQKTQTVRTPLSAITKAYQDHKTQLENGDTSDMPSLFRDNLSLDDPDLQINLDAHHASSRQPHEAVDNKRLVAEILRSLPERLRQVLLLRYGVDQRDSVGYREIADQLGISRERARQLEQEALTHLRRESGLSFD
ncbi:sigma-70 family RNA polymerase sigma factor [Salinispirillum sp. LH 10-3-1]|uniref:Sigma-70 family RNA polymerase sigma factor n=1 Tax=Salinispirillum sp. LH 10-3-1 TaxID=2952525 RepID=A0AB38YIK7_9GAMM